MKTLNFRKGQRTKQRNRILVDLISKIWDSKKLKTEKLTVRLADWTVQNSSIRQPYGQFFCFQFFSPDSLHDWQIFCIEEALQGLKKFIHRITWKTYWKGYVKVVSLFSRWQQTSWAWRLQLVSGIFFAGMLQPRSQGFSLEGGRGGNEVGHASESLLSFRECGVFPANFTQSRIFSPRV